MQQIKNWTEQFGELMKDSDFPLFTEFVREIESIDTDHKAVVSSGSQKYVIPALAKTQINPTHILAFEHHHSKEEKIESICADWNVRSDEVYYFTDTLADIFELRNMLQADKLIAVSWGYCTFAELAQELNEQYILKTPKDIHTVLQHA
jgi:phosphoglycolate phosphatase-like HAD superfamily hydrolase